MDVDKKLGMSLDDLIKKTRKDVPKASQNKQAKKSTEKRQPGKVEKRGKLGVRKSLDKPMREARDVVRSAPKSSGAVVSKRRNHLRPNSVATLKSRKAVMPSSSSRDAPYTSHSSSSRRVIVRKGPNAPVAAGDRRTVKVTNIPSDLTWKDIKGALSEVGVIERCDIVNGEAVIIFATHKEAARAIQTYDNGDMNGRKIRVFFA